MAQRKPSVSRPVVIPSRAARIAVWLVLVSVIAVLPGGFDRWVIPKDAVLAIAAAVGAFGMARGRLPRWFWIGAGIGAILLGISIAGSIAPAAELWGRYPRYEGLISLPVYLAAVWLGARTLGPARDRPIVDAFRSATAVVSVLLGLLSLIEAAGARPLSSDLARPGAFLGNATDQGIVGAMLLAITVASLLEPGRTGRRTVVAGIAAAFSVVTVAVSGSRAALAAAVVALVVLGILWLVRLVGRGRAEDTGSTDAARRPISRRVWLAIGVPVLGLVALAFAIPDTRNRILGLSPLSGQTIGDRFQIWRAAGDVIAAHPLFGVGPSGFIDAVTHTYDPAGGTTLGTTTVLDSPHAWPLQLALAGGIPLLVLGLAAAVWVVVTGLRAWRRSWSGDATGSTELLAGALAAIAAAGLGLATHLTSPGTAILTCFLVGSLISAPTARAARTSIDLTPRAVLAVWAAFLVVMAFSEIAVQSALDEIPQSASQANSALESVQAVRFWDADLASIAAESFAAASDQNAPGAAKLAIVWARRSLAITPGTQASLVALGVGESASGQLPAAVSTLRQAVRGNPANEQAAYRLGVALALQKNYPDARDELLAASRLDKTDPAPWNALAYVYQQLGDKTLANAAHAHATNLGG